MAGGTWRFTEALFLGQAPDGGLFVPVSFPKLSADRLASLASLSFPNRALTLAAHLLGEEIAREVLHKVVHDALEFPVPLRRLDSRVHMLELFHGPTHSFKDVGARFMARMMSALRADDATPITVLAATSGDTGSAVGRAFFRLPGVRVVVLYPLDKVSARQEAQFCTLGGNVTTVAVRGVFDDCQRLVREAFADSDMRSKWGLTSANSINVGRLLPQIFYYAHGWAEAAAATGEEGGDILFAVPSGNFGNLTAGLMARLLGIPIGGFVAATNANAAVPEYLATGVYRSRPTVNTLSNAMDVGNPSNFRRLLHLFGTEAASRAIVTGSSWTDDQTQDCIRDLWRSRGIAVDPHTAVGLLGLRLALARAPDARGIVLGTAHPAKFAEIVEPLVGSTLPVPEGIAQVMDLPRRSVQIVPNLEALREVLNQEG